MHLTFISLLLFLIVYGADGTLDSGCNDYTVDKCVLDDDAIIETLKDSSTSICQFYCKTFYSGSCKFFIHDKQQRICQFVNEELDKYTESCRKIAGPSNPSIRDCEELEDNCKVGIYCKPIRN